MKGVIAAIHEITNSGLSNLAKSMKSFGDILNEELKSISQQSIAVLSAVQSKF